MESITENTAHVESRHAADHNGTNRHETSNASTANVSSNGTSGAGNIGGADDGCIVSELRNLLGQDVVLLPIRAGTKGPILDDWQKTTIEAMQDAEYLARLGRGPIGVLLGKASGSLCAIDIDADEFVEPFLDLNPKLATTLRSKGARGVQLWVRMDGEYPKFAKLRTSDGKDWGEWRSDGGQSIIHGVHKLGMNYRRLVDAHPITITFGEIKWPEELALPWVKDAYDELVEEHGRPYALTKTGALLINEYFFVVRYQREHLVLWEPLEEEFYEYNSTSGLWEIVSEDKIRWQFGLDLKRVADEVAVAKFIWMRKSGTLSSFVNTLRGLVEKRDGFKNRPAVIHFANGMLDLRTNPPKLMSFHPAYCSRNICPISFDPTAECPRFVNELLRSALGDDDVDLLQRWAGSVLLGSNPAQRLLLLSGTAGGGKSTLIEVIEKVIGEQNVAQIRTKHLNKQFELYKFLGKTLLTGKDVGASFLSEDGVENLKALVGNDLLDAEKKHGNEQFQLRGNFNMAITCNSKLRVRLEGDTGAWERRLMVIDYSKPKPKERIPEFAEKLVAAEGPGILNWMIEGAIKYLQEMEEIGDLYLTDEQKARVEVLLAESDSVRQFVRDRVVLCDAADITVAELQQGYFDYCEDMGWHCISNQEFRSTIADLVLEIHHVGKRHDIARKTETHRGFKNITILGGH